jgi:hypothetical protein
VLEQVARHGAARRFIGFDTDEERTPVGRADGAFGELPANVVRLGVVAAADLLPDLLLPRMIVGHREGHQLFERHAVAGIDVEQLVRDGGELQPLLDDGHADEEPRGDVLLAQSLLAQRLEGAELIERMQGLAMNVLGERVLLGETAGPHDAGHRLRLAHALLLDQQFKRPKAAASGRNLEHAGVLAVAIDDRTDAEALQECAPGDVVGQFLDRNAGLDAAHIGLAQDELVEGNVARCAQRDLLNGSHLVSPRRAAGRLSLGFRPVTKTGAALSLFRALETLALAAR